MCEDTSVLLVSARICRDLTILDVVLCICRVVQNQTMLCIQSLVDSSKRLHVTALILTDLRHDCEALWLDEDLTFFTFLRAHLLAICIISTKEPVTIPGRFHNVCLHLIDLSLSSCSFVILAEVLQDRYIVRTCIGKECSNHNRLSNLRVAALSSKLRVCICLEALTRCVRVA